MSHAIAMYRVYDLPWSAGEEQERRFRRILVRCVAAVLAFALVLGLLPVPERAEQAPEIPQRFARLVIDAPPPPPPVVREEPEPEPVPETEPEPEPEPERVIEERRPDPEPTPVPQPEPVQQDRVEQARERASGAGLLPFAQQLAALRDNDALDRLDRAQTASANDGAAPVAERSLITSRVGSRSGGIDTAALSRNTGGGGLAGRATTRVEDPVDAIDTGPAVVRAGSGDVPSRSREEIERVFDQNKSAIFALYNRALRQNPALEGKLVLRLSIAPDGTVTACEIVSSELGDPDLEQRLVQRILLFRFEAKDVAPITTTKPIDFFPA